MYYIDRYVNKNGRYSEDHPEKTYIFRKQQVSPVALAFTQKDAERIVKALNALEDDGK